ncbi:MAG: hypothetical protein EPO22_13215, partial [Dehalococcoidia bacterium]
MARGAAAVVDRRQRHVLRALAREGVPVPAADRPRRGDPRRADRRQLDAGRRRARARAAGQGRAGRRHGDCRHRGVAGAAGVGPRAAFDLRPIPRRIRRRARRPRGRPLGRRERARGSAHACARSVDGQHHPVLRPPQDVRALRQSEPTAPQPVVRGRDESRPRAAQQRDPVHHLGRLLGLPLALLLRGAAALRRALQRHARPPGDRACPRGRRHARRTAGDLDLRGAAVRRLLIVAAFCLLGAGLPAAHSRAQEPPGVKPNTPIEHIIVLMQENHTFDNYFGTFPGADGIPEGTCMPVDPDVPTGAGCIEPFHIGSNDVALGDIDHSSATSRNQYNKGRMNGFVSALNARGQDGRLAMGYYDERDLPYHWFLARNYVLFDRFFSSASTGSLENHVFSVGASTMKLPQPARAAGQRGDLPELRSSLDNSLPTIFDRLQEKGVSWKFYVQNYDPKLTYRTVSQYSGNRASQVIWVPPLNIDRFIDDPELNSHIVNLDEYYQDLKNGTLPAVAYISPSGASEHPPGSLASGQRFVQTLINALQRSSAWPSSAFLLTYDDWGGWFDHVA